MNKRIIVFGLALMMLCGVTGIGCGRQEEHKENSERNEQEEEVRFSYSKQEAGDDTIVSIGSLTITLPEGWRIETRQEGELTQFVLVDVYSSPIYHEVEINEGVFSGSCFVWYQGYREDGGDMGMLDVWGRS